MQNVKSPQKWSFSPIKAQIFSVVWTIMVACMVTWFDPPNSKMLLQDWTGWKSETVLADQQLVEVDKFDCSGSCISPDGLISEEVSWIHILASNFHSLQHSG